MNAMASTSLNAPIAVTALIRAGRTRRLDAVFTALAMLVAAVWLYHGLFNKLLHLKPRHLLIVQSVPGLDGDAGRVMLIVVGITEVIIAGWVLSGRYPIACAITQTVAMLFMNALELTLARTHLLWPVGLLPVNAIFLTLAWFIALHHGRRNPRPAAALLQLLKRHPVAIVADFRNCLVLTYAVPSNVLQPLLPPELTVDTHGDLGFVAVAVVDVRDLRPAFTPRVLGQDFVLAGYRIFCRFRTPDGRTLRGLYILRSDANRWRMVLGGNLLTHYRYHKSFARIHEVDGMLDVHLRTSGRRADVSITAKLDGESTLPDDSPFNTERDARRFAGPLPYTFDYEPETHSIIVIKGTRTHWRPRLVPVAVHFNTFIARLGETLGVIPILASAFHVRDIPYRWERGVRMELPRKDASS